MERSCDNCGGAYEAKRPSSRFCSDLCRKRSSRSPVPTESFGSVHTDGGEVVRFVGPVETAAVGLIDLRQMTGTPQAEMALALARRLDSPKETGSAVASMTKQLRDLMDDLDRRGVRVADPLDELRSRREAKRHA